MQKNSPEFQKLVEEHYIALYRFAYSLSGNEHEASDLTQQTFYIYAEKGDALRDTSKVKTWLFTTLYREFLRIKKRSQKVQTQEPDFIENIGQIVEHTGGRSLDAESAVIALQKVDTVYRIPLVLYFLQNYSYQEIADILEIPIGTVTSRISRGKEQLRSFLFKNPPSST